jgi:hypothetical protein
MSWQWQSFWNVADSTSLERPEKSWVRDTYRRLRTDLNATVAVAVRCEMRSEMHAHLGDVNYDLKVCNGTSNEQLVELDVCFREENGLRSWRQEVSKRSAMLEGDGIIRRRVVRDVFPSSHPEVVDLFEQQKDRMRCLPIGQSMGTTMALNVHLDICRSVLVCHDGIEIEVCEIVARHCGWRRYVTNRLVYFGERGRVECTLT